MPDRIAEADNALARIVPPVTTGLDYSMRIHFGRFLVNQDTWCRVLCQCTAATGHRVACTESFFRSSVDIHYEKW